MTVTLEDAQAHLVELIAKAVPGEEIVITQDDKPVARLIAEKVPMLEPRVPGSAKGMIAYMADDFDAPLKDFNNETQVLNACPP
jgi:prevent-host-death family protein